MKTEFKLPKHIDKFLKEEAARTKAYAKEYAKKPYWKKLGVVGVDSGRLMVCDPCYVGDEFIKTLDNLHGSDSLNWSEEYKHSYQMNYAKGHPGLGVEFSSGGDGQFEVWGKISKCRVIEVNIKIG